MIAGHALPRALRSIIITIIIIMIAEGDHGIIHAARSFSSSEFANAASDYLGQTWIHVHAGAWNICGVRLMSPSLSLKSFLVIRIAS
jgi:hypothetical protein